LLKNLYKSQIPIIEQALETASLMLGAQKSCGYCMEMMPGPQKCELAKALKDI
jgi:hypothetical protein